MAVAAPGLLSTTTGTFRLCESCWPMARATTSVPPPAGKGTTSVMGLLGQASAASAVSEVRLARASAARARRTGLACREVPRKTKATVETACAKQLEYRTRLAHIRDIRKDPSDSSKSQKASMRQALGAAAQPAT